MKIKRVLLTGDDGYNSIGIRLLIHFLKNKYELHFAATKHQQSCVGGYMNLQKETHWGKVRVDGVSGFWIDGTPIDAIEFAPSYYTKPFDLVISGINMGINISGSIMSSGTFAAANRALYLQFCSKAIAISWDVHHSQYFKKHNVNEDLNKYFNYPGKITRSIIELAIKNNFWNTNLLNVNLPEKISRKVKFTRFLPTLLSFYPRPLNIDKKNQTFTYPYGTVNNYIKTDLNDDVVATREGYISITPCKIDPLKEDVFNKLKNKQICID